MRRNRKKFGFGVLLLAVLLSGCGGAGESTKAEMPAASAPAAMEQEVAEDETVWLDMETSESKGAVLDGTSGSTGSEVYRDPNTKLIREAELRIQTTKFEESVSALERMVEQVGGYFQNASLHGGSYRDANANRRGEYIIRIPSERYDSFLGQSGELGYVTYRDERTQDIGERYYDTQARLKTQRTKQDRLLSLLEKSETIEDIIALETALSDVEYQIEQLSSTLNRYDSLVGFATVQLDLHEVYEVSEEPGIPDSLGERMSRGFASSLDGLVDGMQDLLVWLSYNAFGLLISGLVIGAGAVILTHKVSVFKRKRSEPVSASQDKNE